MRSGVALPLRATSNANTAKARPMPTHQRLGTDDREDLQDRWKPSIQLDKEPAILVREPDPTLHLTPQNDQLMSECRILCFKPALRLKWRRQEDHDEAEQCKHSALKLGDSLSQSMWMRFSVHTTLGTRRIPY